MAEDPQLGPQDCQRLEQVVEEPALEGQASTETWMAETKKEALAPSNA